ncbi:MAG: methyltransferase domain-containing protein [Alphaproteobacteria bacterium]
MPTDFTNPSDVLALYRKRAAHYDVTANLYYLIGFREQHYRRLAVNRLALAPGDTVVEIGCGTGLNFALIEEKIGPRGRIIGVDLTDAMLAKARERVTANNWTNVALVESAAADYRFPSGIDGILSTFALTLEPEYDRVIAGGTKMLNPGRRWVVLDFRVPEGTLKYLAPFLVPLVRPFGATLEVARRRPWESVARYLTDVSYEDLYFGFAYIAAGAARAAISRDRP